MLFRPALAALLLMLSGCSGGGAEDRPGDELPPLEATDTTGVIRAVVVDDAIRPLAGALVVVQATGTMVNKTTGDDGFAGFADLSPGSYLVQATKPGFRGLPQTVQVEADVDAPPVVKLLLSPIQGDRPFYSEKVYDGFMQCAVGSPAAGANLCFIANFYPCFAMQAAGQPCPGNATSDNSFFEVPFIREANRVPDWVQVELFWESTQAVSEDLTLRIDIQGPDDTTIPYTNSSSGPSPVHATFNRTIGDEYSLGVNRSLFLEVFTSQSVTSPAGLAVNQQIRYFVHAFYGYVPPVGWRFSDGTGVPPPPY